MANDTKREFLLFFPLDNNSIKQHFERKARQGWLLESIKYNIAKYKRIEPQELVFSVDIYPEISPIKRTIKKDVDYYISLCEDTGWNYITSLNNLHIFYSRKEDELIPVQTDEEYKEKIMSKSITMELIVLFINLLCQIVLLRLILPFDYTSLYSNLSLVNLFFMPMVTLLLFFQIGSYVIWILKAKNNIKKGLPLPNENYNIARAKGTFVYGLSALLIILLISAVILDSINGEKLSALVFLPWLIAIVIGRIYNKKMLQKDKSIIHRIIVSIAIVFIAIAIIMPVTFKLHNKLEDNNLPEGYIGLTLSDFGISKTPQYKSFIKSGSIFVPRRSKYRERYYGNGVYTLHIQGRTSKITRYIFDELIKEELNFRYYRNLVPADNEYKDFDEAYYIVGNMEDNKKPSILLMRGNEIFYIESDYDLSIAENVNIVMNKVDKKQL